MRVIEYFRDSYSSYKFKCEYDDGFCLQREAVDYDTWMLLHFRYTAILDIANVDIDDIEATIEEYIVNCPKRRRAI